jgi:superfamily II DNA or RNA helicase
MNTLNITDHSWVPVKHPEFEMPSLIDLRKWQTTCWNQHKDDKFAIVRAPTASGKTTLLVSVFGYRMLNNVNLRVIFSVPQTIIGSGFVEAVKVNLPNGVQLDWSTNHNLCNKNTTVDSNVEYLKSFFTNKRSKTIADRSVVCSHASLLRFYQKYPKLLKNCEVVIDEMHHIMYGESEEDIAVNNELGKLVEYCLSRSDISVWGSTATFFRGDRYPIIPESLVKTFSQYDYPYDEFFVDCCYPLTHFTHDFLFYKGNSFKSGIKDLFKEKVHKSIIYIPHPLSLYSVDNKHNDVLEAIKGIAGNNNPKIKKEGVLTLVKRGNSWIKVIDLVDINQREEKKAYIQKSHSLKNKNDLDVIIALGMFKEGANWRWAERSIIVGERGSLNEVMQIIGRLFRSAPDKTKVESYLLLPSCYGIADKDKLKENVNNFLKAIMAAMIYENVLTLPRLTEKVDPEPDDDDKDDKLQKPVDYLAYAFPDENEQREFLEVVFDALVDVCADKQIGSDLKTGNKEELKKTITDVISQYDVTKNIDEIVEQVYNQFSKMSFKALKISGIDVDHIDIDLVNDKKDINPIAFALGYASKELGVESFREFRNKIGKYFLPFEEARDIVRQLGIQSVVEWVEFRKKYNGIIDVDKVKDEISKSRQHTA